jgi:succinate dehydrogenase / fumarate reductase, cytochrome b subunit
VRFPAGAAAPTVGSLSLPAATGPSGTDTTEDLVPTVPAGTLYRGREGMWSWVAHRVTGVLIFFFLFAHVLDTALVRVSPEAYDTVMETYKNPVVGVLEVGLVGAVVFHAFNGLRVILVDFWSRGPRVHRQMLYGVVVIWVLLMIPFTIRHLGNVFGE